MENCDDKSCGTGRKSGRRLLLRGVIGLVLGAGLGLFLGSLCPGGQCPLTSSPYALGVIFGLLGLFIGLGGCPCCALTRETGEAGEEGPKEEGRGET